ncbi:MAG: polysaccharide biosynthesis/export family protein, partial [Opitutaceae bacterium]|nr:polysaccharide biosynthesis/export family protein [Opitutaceae bacterium]
MNTNLFSFFFKKNLPLVTLGFLIVSGSNLLAQPTADVSYRLSIRDQIEISLFDEPELNDTQRIDGQGQIEVSLIGPTTLTGLT